MSVNNMLQNIKAEVQTLKHEIRQIKTKTCLELQQQRMQLCRQFSSLVSSFQIQTARKYQRILHNSQNEIAKLKQQNTTLKQNQVSIQIQSAKTKSQYEKLLSDFEDKNNRIFELVEQVATIKTYIQKLKQLKNDGQKKKKSDAVVVDFDEENEVMISCSGELEIIKEQNQNDISMQNSQEVIEQSSENQLQIQNQNSKIDKDNSMILAIPSSEGSQQLPQINDYVDALQIFKNYNNRQQITLTTNTSQGKACDNNNNYNSQVILKVRDNNCDNTQKSSLNSTIEKIKKIRKIDEDNVIHKFKKKDKQSGCGSFFQSENSDSQNSLFSKSNQKSKNQNSLLKTKKKILKYYINLEKQIQSLNQKISFICQNISQARQIEKIKQSLHKIQLGQNFEYYGHTDFDQGMASGYGKLKYKNETLFQGEWKYGKFHGWGKLLLIPFVVADEKSIIEINGNFIEGSIQGSFSCVFSNGDRFMGMMKKQNIEREGTYISKSTIMTGHWKRNKLVSLI